MRRVVSSRHFNMLSDGSINSSETSTPSRRLSAYTYVTSCTMNVNIQIKVDETKSLEHTCLLFI